MYHRKVLIIILILACFTISGNVHGESNNLKKGHLKVSEDGRLLQFQDGKPFLWIGDTAWELFHRLNREEAEKYLKDRAEKGFTIIQAVVLAEQDGLNTPNPYGETPLIDNDPARPNDKYFEHVDFIVNKAEELGLYVGMLPTWGDKVLSDHPGAGPVVFDEENAEVYGKFLGKRYQNKPIVWILGGDRNVDNKEAYRIWNAMARGIKKGDDGKHLMTFHPRGGAMSFYWFHNQDWLDFNMYQSGHGKRFNEVYKIAQKHKMISPKKPFLDGEPAYEDIPIKFWEFCDWSNPKRVPTHVLNTNNLIKDKDYFEHGYFTDYDVRIHAYWNFLAGACGYTYGNNAIWQMFDKDKPIAIPCLTNWKDALERPGGQDMQHVRALLESRPFEKLIPDQSIIHGINPDGEKHIQAAGSLDNSYLLVYLSVGQPVKLFMDKIKGETAVAWWYNPRNGKSQKIGEYKATGMQNFEPPSSGKNNDWILVIDSKMAGYHDLPG